MFLSTTTYTEPTMTCVIILSRIYSNVYKKAAAALCSVVVAKALKCFRVLLLVLLSHIQMSRTANSSIAIYIQ